MKILIVVAHPESKSFNMEMTKTAITTLQQQGHEVQISDLYKMDFDAVSGRKNFTSVHDASCLNLQKEEMYASKTGGFVQSLKEEQHKVEWCDLMIWQFPLWWFSVPAILKGWVDRVFAMGTFYDNGKIYKNGMLKGRKALLSLTTGGPLVNYSKDVYGEMHDIVKPVHRGIFEFLGFEVLQPQVYYSIERMNNEERAQALGKWSDRLKKIFEEDVFNIA